MQHFDKPATSRLLLVSLCDFCRDALADYVFPAPDRPDRDCHVFLNGLPEGQQEATYPFVIVRWLEGEISSSEDGQTILRDTVMLALGVYAPKSQTEAGLLCAELLDCLRRSLWKKRIIGRRFELVEPLRSAMPEPSRQIHNYHLATIETVWNYVWPQKALELAGQSQMLAGAQNYASYLQPEVEHAFKQAKDGNYGK